MRRTMQNALVIQDISVIGRSSLAVVIPVLAALGVQPCPLPTAVYSTHLGGFGQPAKATLTTFMREALTHYQQQDIDFSGIYSGFLGEPEQAQIVLDYFAVYPEALKVVDPAFADHGHLYQSVLPNMVEQIRRLVIQAEVITPNLTEAAFLLEKPMPVTTLSENQIKEYLLELAKLGAKNVIITGAVQQQNQIENYLYCSGDKSFWKVVCSYHPVAYPGTGDMFASIITGCLLRGTALPQAMATATHFIGRMIQWESYQPAEPRFGLPFESYLGWLHRTHHSLKPVRLSNY